MSEMKMSDMFELPVRASQLEVYGANSNPGITFEDIEKAAAHAINNHDKLTEQNAKLVEMLNEIIKEADYSYALDVDLYDSANQLLTEIKGQE